MRQPRSKLKSVWVEESEVYAFNNLKLRIDVELNFH